jgi:CRP/FNR family cyclic AMP-dependent transcriptional regulator
MINIAAEAKNVNSIFLKDFFVPKTAESPQKLWEKYIKIEKYDKGAYIYSPNKKAEYVYFVRKGRIKISLLSDDGKTIIKAVLQEGEVFGELALIGEQNRTEFAQAMENSEIQAIPLYITQNLMQQNQQFGQLVIQLIGSRLLQTQRRLEALVFCDARSRIIQFLSNLATEKGRRVGYEMLVPKFFTHQEIANLTDTSRQTVTTILNELRAENLIYFDRKRLLVRDVKKLQAMLS